MVDLTDIQRNPPLFKRIAHLLDVAVREKKALRLTTRSERITLYKIAAAKKIKVRVQKRDGCWVGHVYDAADSSSSS